MALSIGIVGLPNVGKSTLFNALTKKSVLVANYPFATIDPSVGVVAVPDERREKLAALSQSGKDIPAAGEFDAIAHVVRIFDNPNVANTQEAIDPLADIELINTELALADLDQKDEKQKISHKPVLYVLNKEADGHNLDEMAGDERWRRLMEYFEKNNAKYVIVDAHVESELRELHADDKQQFRQEYGVFDDGINALIRGGYDLLGLISFFTTGKDETRAWTITRGSTAPRAGAAIHSDFERS